MALALSASLVFAACGSDDDSADGEEPTTEETTAEEPTEETTAEEPTEETTAEEPTTEETTAEATGDDVVIPVWIAFEDYRLDWTNEVATAFNEQVDGYTVQITGFASYNDAFEAAVQAINTGEPPAVVHFFEAATQEATRRDLQ